MNSRTASEEEIRRVTRRQLHEQAAELLDQVELDGMSFIVTRNRRPIAMLTPVGVGLPRRMPRGVPPAFAGQETGSDQQRAATEAAAGDDQRFAASDAALQQELESLFSDEDLRIGPEELEVLEDVVDYMPGHYIPSEIQESVKMTELEGARLIAQPRFGCGFVATPKGLRLIQRMRQASERQAADQKVDQKAEGCLLPTSSS